MDGVLDFRDALSAFWRHKGWSVHDTPGPADTNPDRYAFIAGCAYLLVRSFNERIKLGLRRDMSSLIIPEEAGKLRSTPLHLRKWEEGPDWASKVLPLQRTLIIPTYNRDVLEDKEDP